MRSCIAIALAACSSVPNTRLDAQIGPNGGADGAPPPLRDLLQTVQLPAVAPVMAGDPSFRVWGQGSLGVSPVFVDQVDCTYVIGYTTGSEAAPAAHVELVRADTLMDGGPIELGPYVLRGLASDGTGFAALLWDPTKSPATLHVAHYVGDQVTWSTPLVDTLAAPTDFKIGDSRLAFAGSSFAAYYHVHGISGFALGHEGDQLEWLDGTSGAMSTGWSWGCSHSMSAALRGGPTGILSACMTDCYPGTTGPAIGGVYLDRQTKVLDVLGACNGSVGGELGSLATAASGWKLVWTSHQAPATPGGSYDPQTMNQDVAFVSIDPTRQPAAPVWLTSTPEDESNASIAQFGKADQYVVGWHEGAAYYVELVAGDGSVLQPPGAIAAKWGERDDPFRTDRDGNIVWAWFDAAGDSTLHFALLGSVQSCGI